jgi:hypothetical protein
MHQEIVKGQYSFWRFYPIAFLKGMVVFVLVALFVEIPFEAIWFILFIITLVLFPVLVSTLFSMATEFSVYQEGLDISIFGLGKFIEWKDISSVSSRLGILHVYFSRYGFLNVPSPYFMKNRDEVYKAIDKYAPPDSPARKIMK